MSFRPFFTDVLTDLKLSQAVDDHGPDHETGEEGCQACERSPERKVAEDAEWRKVMEQLDEKQPVKQSASEPVVGRWFLAVSQTC